MSSCALVPPLPGAPELPRTYVVTLCAGSEAVIVEPEMLGAAMLARFSLASVWYAPAAVTVPLPRLRLSDVAEVLVLLATTVHWLLCQNAIVCTPEGEPDTP